MSRLGVMLEVFGAAVLVLVIVFGVFNLFETLHTNRETIKALNAKLDRIEQQIGERNKCP